MCNCMSDSFEQVKEKIKEGLPDGVIDSTLGFSIDNQIFRFDGNDNDVPAMKVNFEYKVFKRDGSEPKNFKRDSVLVFGSYCPFCGEPHKKPESKEQ